MFPTSTSPYIWEVTKCRATFLMAKSSRFSAAYLPSSKMTGGRRAVSGTKSSRFQRHGSLQILRDHRVIVQAWQSGQAVRRALSAGLETVASPMEFAYLNYKSTPYNLMQTYDPLLLSCDRTRGEAFHSKGRLLLGAGACLWTEYVPDERTLNRIGFPRSEALAEAFWSANTQLMTTEACAHTSLKTHLEYGDEYFGVSMVMDNNDTPLFWSEGPPAPGDHVTVRTVTTSCPAA